MIKKLIPSIKKKLRMVQVRTGQQTTEKINGTFTSG